MAISDGDVRAVAKHCTDTLGPVDTWIEPRGYPDSLALCVLDSIWSIGVRYEGVVGVLQRYRAIRRAADADIDPERDGPAELLAAMSASGGPVGWADALSNHQRTSSRGGILKAEAVGLEAAILQRHGVLTPHDVRALVGPSLVEVQRAWQTVPGQRSGISWRYLLLLSGVQEVKPDRMLIRFVAAAIGRPTGANETGDLVTAAAAELGVPVRTLDHRIWRYASDRG